MVGTTGPEGTIMVEKETFSRREFLRKSGYAAGGVVGGSLVASLITMQILEEPKRGKKGTLLDGSYHDAFMFFTNRDDFRVLAAGTERIFPEDEHGPGAIKLGVPFFIDHQLAGAWGNNAREYRQGPFYKGEQTQGAQSRLTRGEIFRQGIRIMKEISQQDYNGSFQDLTADQQDDLLLALERNKVTMKGASSAEFFELLRAATLEGAYADPLYGGNRDMEGWRMKQYPGAQMAYRKHIDKRAFVEMEPQSLHNMLNK